MNDRYLYRAKRKSWRELPKDKWWVEGYLYGIWERRYILWGMTNDVPNMVEVEPSTICQCTGLRDKNGKLIWENDILLSFYNPYSKNKKPNSRLIVNWDSDVSGTGWFGRKYYDYHYNSYSKEPINKGLYYTEEMERIGNIFDNPELLEVGE